MKIYILHYGWIDSEGVMSIDCKKFDLLEDAISEKNNLIKHFKEEHKGVEAKFIEEECGFFIRIAITDGISEIQIHIEKFEA